MGRVARAAATTVQRRAPVGWLGFLAMTAALAWLVETDLKKVYAAWSHQERRRVQRCPQATETGPNFGEMSVWQALATACDPPVLLPPFLRLDSQHLGLGEVWGGRVWMPWHEQPFKEDHTERAGSFGAQGFQWAQGKAAKSPLDGMAAELVSPVLAWRRSDHGSCSAGRCHCTPPLPVLIVERLCWRGAGTKMLPTLLATVDTAGIVAAVNAYRHCNCLW